LGHVLEHVDDPVEVLSLCKLWLVPNAGRIYAAVPHCNSLHRQIGVSLGMLESVDQLSDSDISIGHKRVYSRDELKKDFLSSGLTVLEEGGFYLKTLSNAQISKVCDKPVINALMSMGVHHPEIASNIYILACTESDEQL